MDVTDVGPFTRVQCPQCSEEVRVKTEMGPYVLRRRLAMGGMSVLFVAYDSTLGREVAVKVLNEDYSDDETRVAQFEREARLTAAVSHPNVVRVYTVGRAFGRYFIAMELVSGRSLEVVMDERGALPEAEIMPIALQVVAGLRAAHAAGLIHRDIKPGNILIEESGTAKIVDFGLSLLTEGGEVKAEEIWATPYYVPPETLIHAEEDFRSDIYALGSTVYHALSGRPPVESREMSTRALIAEKKQVLPLGRIASWLRPETIAVVNRAMAHSPSRRFKSYEEFRSHLEDSCQAIAGDPESTPIHSSARAERRRRSGERRGILAAAIFVVLLVLGIGVFLVVKNAANRGQGSVAVAPSSPVDVPVGGSPELTAMDARRISEAYRQAREALASHDFVAAERWFAEVADDATAPAATAGWARFEAVTAAYLNGHPGDARGHIAKLRKDLKARGTTETALGRRLRAACQVCDSLEFVSDERIPRALEDPMRATVFFVMALKMWEQGQLDRSRDHLMMLVDAGPWEDAEWMSIYQELAHTYLEEHARLGEVGGRIEMTDVAAMQAKHDELAELYVLLRTRGRARFNVRAWQADLKTGMRQIEDAKGVSQWGATREKVFKLWREGEFVAAKKALVKFQPSTDETALQKSAMLALVESAVRLMHKLGQTEKGAVFDEKIRERGGREFDRLLRGERGSLVVMRGGNRFLLGIERFELGSLLAMHLHLLRAVEDEDARKLGLGAATAFAIMSGLSSEEDLFERVRKDPAPGGFGTWEDLRPLIQGE
jgi:predicted Ser/Thr protein kinase